jgi:hypothetical protein
MFLYFNNVDIRTLVGAREADLSVNTIQSVFNHKTELANKSGVSTIGSGNYPSI